MSELSFLLDLLFDHELPKDAQKLVRDRIKEIESRGVTPAAAQFVQRPQRAASMQSPSTQKILDEMAAEGFQLPSQAGQVIEQQNAIITQPAVIAQTPAVAAAMAARQEAIRIAVSGKEEKGRTAPRKF